MRRKLVLEIRQGLLVKRRQQTTAGDQMLKQDACISASSNVPSRLETSEFPPPSPLNRS